MEHYCDPNNVPSFAVDFILSKISSDEPSTSPSQNPTSVYLLMSIAIPSTDPSETSGKKTLVLFSVVISVEHYDVLRSIISYVPIYYSVAYRKQRLNT